MSLLTKLIINVCNVAFHMIRNKREKKESVENCNITRGQMKNCSFHNELRKVFQSLLDGEGGGKRITSETKLQHILMTDL